MRRIVFILFSTCLFLSSCIQEKEEPLTGANLKIGDKIPHFTVKMNDGSIISEENLKGCISLIVFFHTSCKDCRQVLPVLQRFHEAYSQYPIACISRAENEVAVAAYWKEQGFTLPYSAQEDRTVYELFAQTGVPRIYIVDEEGIIRCLFTDQMLPEWEELVKALDKLT